MRSEISALIDEATALLRTYTLALNERGEEITELRDAAVSNGRLAQLYPHEPKEWSAGIEHLLHEDPVLRDLRHPDGSVKPTVQRSLTHPAALTVDNWLICRSLTRLLSPKIPNLSELQREAYRKTGTITTKGQDRPNTHVHLIIMLLHILAFSPIVAEELESGTARRYVTTMLTSAEDLTHERRFALPLPRGAAS